MQLSESDTATLVRAAQDGDADSLAALFRVYYPGMRSIANHILGFGPDAEDACQDAAVAALGRIGKLRDPSAVRAWLHAIVRNNCRDIQRARKHVLVEVAGTEMHAGELDTPGTTVERDAERDWVRHALRQLTPAVRPVAVLRYFTEHNSYEQIAELCGIPLGTVRSRLSDARRQLAVVLPQVRDDRHEDSAALTAERREEAAILLSGVANGVLPRSISGRWAADAAVSWPDGRRSTGLPSIFEMLRHRHQSGVRFRLADVVAGPDTTVWVTGFSGPPHDPHGCPPAGTWMLHERDGMVREVRLVHTPRLLSP